MVWITMSLAPHAGSKKRKKNDSKPHSQINKCLNEKRRREQENIHLEELAELVSASPSDMTSNPHKQDKCAILKETVNQIRSQKQSTESEFCDDLQQSEVSSSKPNIINNQIFGSILLEALEGFLFVVNIEGKVEFVSENIFSFLKFEQDDVIEKNIFDFIHPDDRPRFNSNLLLMMPVGNGRSGDWPSENNFNSTGKPTKHFNCRFLVCQDKPEIKMENKPTVPQYENLNITANFIPLGTDGDSRNGLTCIARRVAVEEKRIGINKVEQFTTRIDREGKVIDVDISILSPGSGQFLKKELTGAAMLDFCHPSDIPMFKQHLKEAMENGHSTCNPFKFRVSRDKYAKVKTKSKRFQGQTSVGDIIISTHSIIRDSDSLTALDGQKSVSSPSSVASTSSGPGSVSDSSTSVNGGVALSPLAMSNSYGSYSVSTPQNSTEFGLSDLVLDMFPNSSWPIDQNSQIKENDLNSATSFVSSPQAAPSSNRSSETSATASPTNSAFVSGLASSRSGSSVPSPAMQSRTPTPFGGSCYSPSASQSSSGRGSPPRALPAKADSLNCSSTETSGINSLSQGIRQERQFDLKSNQKLRNLLTQSTDDSISRLVSRQTSQEVTVIGESRGYEETPNLSVGNVREAPSASRPKTNVILRDLLNQDDDEDGEVPLEPIYGNRSDISSVPNPLLNVGACKGTESGAQQRLGNNNMLRQLLNSDDNERRKSQEMIHQLLIEGSGNKVSPLQSNKSNIPNILNPRILESSVPNPVNAESSRGTPDVTFISETPISVKRKITEKDPNTTVKRQNSEGSHAQLAGQNPMLASMLAQTPRSLSTVVPTSVVSTIMTQLPQERLPKNLEKKLVHTPYTTASTSGTSTSSQAFQNLVAQPMQKDIVTSDSRGHIMQTSLPYTLQNVKNNYLQQVDKIITLEENLLAPQLDLNFSTSNTPVQNSTFVQQLAQNSTQNVNTASNTNFLSEANLMDTAASNSTQINQASDPVFAEILEQIYSLQEEHNVETCKAEDRAAILKLLGDVIEPPQANITNQTLPTVSAQDLNEKIAISAIQKELMEGSALAVSTRPGVGVIATYSQAGRSGTQVSGTPTVQTSLTAEQILLLQQQQQLVAGALPPNYSLVTNRVKLPNVTQSQLINNPELLAQAQGRGLQIVRNTYVNIGNNPQLRKSIKQKAYLQQQQKRLLEQQQKQHLTMQTQQPLDVLNSTGASPFPENMNDLLNNTVAPNVTLLRSSDISEVPGSSRFSITASNPVPSPTNQTSPTSSQLSPGQRVNPRSPFSPLSQQVFPSQTPPPTSYQAAGLSPHPPPPPTYSQGGPSQSPLPIPPTTSPHLVLSPQPSAAAAQSPQWNRPTTSPIQNLQLQNPLLNAQLSQTSIGSNQQIRLTAQQRQQLALRSLPNSTSVTVSRSSSLTSQSDSNYPPLSPIMVLQSQQPQRIQRTISVPDRISTVSQNQPSFTSSESVLSPQPLPSPTFVAASTPVSSVSSIPSSPAVPLTFSTAQNNVAHFTFDGQNIQVFASSANDLNLRSPASVQVASDIGRQDGRHLLGSRSHVSISAANVLQSLPSGSTTRVLNVQNLSRETLEELGLSMNLLQGADAQSSSQALHSQALLNVSSNLDSSSQPVISTPRVQVEESRPADQKKSLLQQLLSEPT